MSLPVILYFARGYQAEYFPTLRPTRHRPLYVTLAHGDSRLVRARGGDVAACFEADFATLTPAPVPAGYLASSLVADRFLGRLSHEDRMLVLGRQITFWAQLLDKYRPVAVVNELVAIEISEVLLNECRSRRIPYLAGMNCPVDDWFYWLPDPQSLSGRHLRKAEPSENSLLLARAYMQQAQARDYQPFYVKNLAGRRQFRPLLIALAKWLLWKWRKRRAGPDRDFRYELYDDEYAKRIEVFLKGFWLRYDRLDELPPDREVVFYPMHQEPEATLNYMSEFYANQTATIENILKCMDVNQVLVVKEHPVDKGTLLRDKFQALKAQYSGLYYLPAEVHGREVLARATRAVTLTSTLGWEAAILGRSVYVLGRIFYDHAPGVTRVTNFDELRRELRKPLQPRVPDLPALTHFVAGMVEQGYPGNPLPHDQLYSETNRQRVLYAIEHAAGIVAEPQS